jgi:hypothetical protein
MRATTAAMSPSRPAPQGAAPLPQAGSPTRPAARGGHSLGSLRITAPEIAGSGAPLQAKLAPSSQSPLQLDDDDSGVGTAAGGLAGLGLGAFVLRNFRQQQAARRGGPVDLTSRLGALRATQRFLPGTVGHGAHGGISAIHLLLGGLGQSNIGSLFGGPEAQNLLGQPIGSSANRGLGSLEHQFWLQRLLGRGARGRATVGERFGGLLGSSVPPGGRAMLQRGFNAAPRLPRTFGALAFAAATGFGLHHLNRLRQRAAPQSGDT